MKVVDHAKKEVLVERGTNVSKSIRYCSYNMYFMFVVNKHAEQTNSLEGARK
jgi:hypothetical protein